MSAATALVLAECAAGKNVAVYYQLSKEASSTLLNDSEFKTRLLVKAGNIPTQITLANEYLSD